LDPFTVNVRPDPPAIALVGDREEMVGTTAVFVLFCARNRKSVV
jgi:hypothetical protein